MYAPSTRSRGFSSAHIQPPPSATAPPPTHATHCSLRGARSDGNHPLHQNPPSIAETYNESSGFDDIPLAPPPSALTSTHYDPHASSSPLHDYTPSHAGHQRSLTGTFLENCRPLVNRATSTLQQHTSKTSFHSPTKSLASFIPSRSAIDATAAQPKLQAGKKIISDWFSGASAPVSLGIVPSSKDRLPDDYSDSEEEEEDMMIPGFFNRGRPAPQGEETPKPMNNSNSIGKFGWLLSNQTHKPTPTEPAPVYHNPSDELLKLNISEALFPHGPVDPLAPSSFYDLLSTAERLLTRYQNSYRALSTSLSDAIAEQSAQDDELDEAETRVRHLKMQLETMATRANEQDAQMQKLREELRMERRLRKEEEDARKKSLALVRETSRVHNAYNPAHPSEDASTPLRRKRISNSEISVDSGFESECDSEVASVFSRANGPLSPTDTVASSIASEAGDARPTVTTKNRPTPLQRTSTYDKVLTGKVELERGGWGCANCEGGAQSAVWGRLAKEREENKVLKGRVEELEGVVLGALNVVDGPWGF